MTAKKSNTQTNLLILIFVFLVLQNPLQAVLSPMGLLDELLGIALFPLFFIKLYEKNYYYSFSAKQMVFFGLLFCFWLSGFIGFAINRYQSLMTTVFDSYACVKFFFAIGTGYLLFYDISLPKEHRKLFWTLNSIVGFFAVMMAADLVLHIFPATTRGGLRSVQLFYSHPTYLASACVFFCAVYMRLYEYEKNKVLTPLMVLWVITVFTLRMKAIGAVIIMFFIYMIVIRHRRKISFFLWAGIGALVLIVASYQLIYYYMGAQSGESARAVLTTTSIHIMRDYFPFGTGWATFGSSSSADPYSPVYYLYHINNVWGLSPTYSAFISDTFWPIIIAQSGFIGLILYGILLLLLFCVVLQMGRKNAYSYASALTSIIYLMITSTGESSFMNPISIPFALWIGYLLAETGGITGKIRRK